MAIKLVAVVIFIAIARKKKAADIQREMDSLFNVNWYRKNHAIRVKANAGAPERKFEQEKMNIGDVKISMLTKPALKALPVNEINILNNRKSPEKSIIS